MYRKNDGQISLAEFNSPFGKLDKNNRWVQISNLIPWDEYEDKYAERFSADNGAPAIPFRMAMGTLIIKQKTGHSDEEVLQDIIENPYMQYLIGLHEFTTTPPFTSVSITNFRKYITSEMIKEINNNLFRTSANNNNNQSNPPADPPTDGDDDASQQGTKKADASAEKNKGKLLLDATCAPANITYPTDIGLLNAAREKLEEMIDTLHPHTGDILKPRTYRKNARRDYLSFVKQRKPRKNIIRKAVGQQLRYVSRDIGHIDRQLSKTEINKLSKTQQQWLLTIRELYRQQQKMYDEKSHSVENRIVSISQPHVRPIIRGKASAQTEFGAKVSISLVDGYSFIDRLAWDAYNEEALLRPAVEAYKAQHGYYPEAVLADKIYRNRNNLNFCKSLGIRLSGPRLGRPPKETDKAVKRLAREDSAERNAVEGKFGEGKIKYGLNRIMARLKDSSETVIAMSFFCLNLSRRLRFLFDLFLWRLISVENAPSFSVLWVF